MSNRSIKSLEMSYYFVKFKINIFLKSEKVRIKNRIMLNVFSLNLTVGLANIS